MQKIKILIIRFKNIIRNDEVPIFRGALIHALGKEADILFHNHQDESFRYAYPLIQYKRINKKASILCLNQGTETIGKLFSECNFNFNFKGQEVEMEIESIKATQFLIQPWDTMFSYRIRKWLPLNQENYKEFIALEGIVEKSTFLEKILIGNILSFSKGINLFLEKEVLCKLLQFDEPKVIIYKGVKMMCFDAEFKSNVSLPDYIGLGKGVSLGMGMITRKREQKSINKE